MRRIALAAALLAGLAGGGVVPTPAQAQCGFVVVWQDRAYLGAQRSGVLPEPGDPVRGALEPGCNDTAGADERPTPIRATTVAGAPPEMALLARGTVLIAYGYLPPSRADETRGCTLGGPVRITGPTRVAFGFVRVDVARSTVRLHHLLRGSAQVFLDRSTRIDGLTRNGQAYIGIGQRVQVDARFCKVPGATGAKIVARRIAPAGPIVSPPTAEDVLGGDWRGTSGAVGAGGGRSWAAYAALALVAVVAGLLLARRRSPRSGTG